MTENQTAEQDIIATLGAMNFIQQAYVPLPIFDR